jgi:hypothetical protein
MEATTALESTPPDRKAPTGTSLTICMRTERSMPARTRSTHSPSGTPSSTLSGSRQ